MAIVMLLSKTKIINLEQNMSQLNFNVSTASLLLESSEQFPVDFDQAWQWLGYSRKSDCLEFLKNNFVVNRDFAATAAKLHSSKGGRPSTEYYLTVECFKMIGMMAGTEQGKQVRLYFLECEKVAKTKSQPKTPTEALLETVQMLVAQERRLAVVEQRSTQSEHRIANLEQQQQDALNGLLDLPVPEVEPQPLTVRFALNRLVRGYAAANSLLPTGCYRRLHLEFRDRYHIDLIARGKNAKPKVSGVEYAEQHWMIEHLYSVAVELFGADKTPSFPSREL
jgi:phage anti-repressor protein